jgi:hypothetical protein
MVVTRESVCVGDEVTDRKSGVVEWVSEWVRRWVRSRFSSPCCQERFDARVLPRKQRSRPLPYVGKNIYQERFPQDFNCL